jgi:TetR/AcrR family transcriptional repressor of nem operon
MEFFWEHGYRGAGVTELLDHIGLGRQSLYDAFGNKRGLYLRAITHYRSTQLAQVLEILQRPGSPLDNVRAGVRFFEKLARDKSMRGCFVANALLETNSDDPELRKFLEETLQLLEGGYRQALTAARRAGELQAGKSPRSIARALTNASIGLAVTGRLGQGSAVIADIYKGTLAMLQ